MKKLSFILPLISLEVYAGMPSISINDIASARLTTISFFLFIIVISIFIFKYLWNSLSKSFEKMPTLSLKQSAIFVVTLSILANILLLMISGARELLTPGAWEKTPEKATYRLKTEEK